MSLLYSSAYHLHCEMTLRSERKISLETLDQQRTYAGCSVGYPDQYANDMAIKSALQRAEKHCVLDASPHLIPPRRRDYRQEPGDMREFVARSPWRIAEYLPAVCCVGSFQHIGAVRDPTKWCSVLTIVWFQDEFALPILDPALGQLLDLDWESLAMEIGD